jgi:hypothetical protein
MEGGGVTVSAFLEANLLDRLHMAIARLLSATAAAIRLRLGPPSATVIGRATGVSHGRRRVFDCDLRTSGDPDGHTDATVITRVI